MALPVKNSCKPGILVTFAAPRPAAERGQMLIAEGGCGIYWGGGFIPAPPPRLLNHVETPNICFHKVIESISQEHV